MSGLSNQHLLNRGNSGCFIYYCWAKKKGECVKSHPCQWRDITQHGQAKESKRGTASSKWITTRLWSASTFGSALVSVSNSLSFQSFIRKIDVHSSKCGAKGAVTTAARTCAHTLKPQWVQGKVVTGEDCGPLCARLCLRLDRKPNCGTNKFLRWRVNMNWHMTLCLCVTGVVGPSCGDHQHTQLHLINFPWQETWIMSWRRLGWIADGEEGNTWMQDRWRERKRVCTDHRSKRLTCRRWTVYS